MLNYLPWNRPAEWGGRICVGDNAVELTYDGFAERVDAAAEQFTEYGVGPGSVVAVMLPNRVELLIAIVAAWRLGAAATPINPTFTANEADYQIDDADAALVVTVDPDFSSGGRPVLPVSELRRAPASDGLPAPVTRENDLALVIYTSGSTGRPKGVLLSHLNIGSMAGSMATALSLSPDDHCLLVLPLFHVNAICVSYLATMLGGGRLSILDRFRPTEFLAAIETLRPTYFSAVPTIYSHLVSLPGDVVHDTSSVRFAICGAAPASAELIRATEERFGFRLLEGYGLTEGTCASTATPVDGPHKPGTVGTALPGQTVAIMGPDGDLLPPGESGEVVIAGPNVMQGYLNRPEATDDALADGWLHTGDVGILDDDGHLRLVDRIKDMIIRGGENIYPKEIETVLGTHPAVLEAAVVGAPDALYGEIPVAFVQVHPDHADSLEVDELREVCRTNLAKIKVPATITLIDAMPTNAVGKIDKPTLRKTAEQATAQGD